MNLFYAPSLTQTDTLYTFDKEESRHIAKVLRKRVGSELVLTNGKGGWFTAEIIDDNPKKTQVQIKKHLVKEPRDYQVQVAMAPTKSNDRYEWFLEKATEMGIDKVVPVLTKHSERKKINRPRYDKVLIAAMKQSLQAYKPTITELMSLDKFLEQDFSGYKKLLAYCKADLPVLQAIQPKENIVFLVGPEGGFSPEEITLAIDKGFTQVKLSSNRLRTETAGLAGVMAANLKNA